VGYRHLRHSSNRMIRRLMNRDWIPSTMAASDAARAERDLADDPEDQIARASLIQYYELASADEPTQNNPRYGELEEKREQLILWSVAHHPECTCLASPSAWLRPDDVHYSEAKQIWLRQVDVHSKEVSVVANAALALRSDPELSRQLANRALAIQPNNPKMLETVAASYTREMRFTDSVEDRRLFAKRALQAWEACAANGGDRLLPELAISAFEAGDFVKAKQYATQLLDTSRVQYQEVVSDNLHIANTILGRLALRKGDIAEARRRLLASAPEDGSPILSSYGPRMALAAELLDHGERDVVIVYLDKCARFWAFGRGQIGQWKLAIREGKKPDFGDNLRP